MQGCLRDQDSFSEKSEALDSHSMLGHAKVGWVIRIFLLRNQRHWTHSLCWNMQSLVEWWEHFFWEIRGTGLTFYVGTCKGWLGYLLRNQRHWTHILCWDMQRLVEISSEKSKALDSQPMLEHAKFGWVIRIFLLRNQRHWTHILFWNMQRLVEWSGHLFWKIRGTRLTAYIGICRRSLLRNQRHWTHILHWNIQRLVEWSGHLFWKIRGTGLTAYIGTCKDWLNDQDISSEKSEALDSQPMLEHTKIGWVIRTSLLRNQIRGTGLTVYVGTCKGWLRYLLRNQRHWTHILCWNMQKSIEWSEHLFWEIRGTGLTAYVGTCKGWLNDQNIFSEKSKTLDSQSMLEHAKVGWVIRTSLLRNQRHWTHSLHWNMQRLVEWSGHLFWEIRGTGLTAYIGTCKDWLSDQDISSEKSEALDSQTML